MHTIIWIDELFCYGGSSTAWKYSGSYFKLRYDVDAWAPLITGRGVCEHFNYETL